MTDNSNPHSFYNRVKNNGKKLIATSAITASLLDPSSGPADEGAKPPGETPTPPAVAGPAVVVSNLDKLLTAIAKLSPQAATSLAAAWTDLQEGASSVDARQKAAKYSAANSNENAAQSQILSVISSLKTGQPDKPAPFPTGNIVLPPEVVEAIQGIAAAKTQTHSGVTPQAKQQEEQRLTSLLKTELLEEQLLRDPDNIDKNSAGRIASSAATMFADSIIKTFKEVTESRVKLLEADAVKKAKTAATAR